MLLPQQRVTISAILVSTDGAGEVGLDLVADLDDVSKLSVSDVKRTSGNTVNLGGESAGDGDAEVVTAETDSSERRSRDCSKSEPKHVRKNELHDKKSQRGQWEVQAHDYKKQWECQQQRFF